MEFIQKKIKQITTTGSTSGTTGNSYVIIPDTGVTYTMNILLTQQNKDWGFFDTFLDPLATGVTGTTISSETYIVSGQSKSRLSELRKYSVSGTLDKLYFTSTNQNIDGVNPSLTTTGQTYTYYIGGITYVDNVSANTTIFNFLSSGYTSPNFVNLPYIKDEAKQNIIDKPEVNNNVFIIREEQQIFDKNYRLRNIKNLSELRYYAGGAFFNIVENT